MSLLRRHRLEVLRRVLAHCYWLQLPEEDGEVTVEFESHDLEALHTCHYLQAFEMDLRATFGLTALPQLHRMPLNNATQAVRMLRRMLAVVSRDTGTKWSLRYRRRGVRNWQGKAQTTRMWYWIEKEPVDDDE